VTPARGVPAAAGAGDGASFEAFFVDTYPQARRLATRIVGNPAAAEDVAAEALARACVRWRSLSRSSYREAWVLRVATNLAIDSVRRRPRWLSPAGVRGPEEPVTDRVVLGAALAKLPRRQRQVVTLRYLLDLPEAEVAELLGIARGTVKASCSHAVAAMREVLQIPV
jgi:RNA polymerase sigma-70 factor (sigma-E family)